MKLEEISESEYNKFIKKFDNTLFFQSVEWGKFKSKTNWNMNILGLKKGKTIKAALIVLNQRVPILNKKIYYSPRGFIVDYSDFELLKELTDKLKQFLKDNNALFLKINPYVSYQERDKDGNIISENNDKLVNYLKKLGYKHYGFYIKADEKRDLEPRWLSVLNLENKSEEQLLQEMRSTTRWMINKSYKNFITIKEACYDDIQKFKDIMVHTSSRRGFDDRPISYYQMMFKELKKSDMIRILFAEIDLKKAKESYINDIKKLDNRINNIINNPTKINQVNEFKSQIESLNKKIEQVDNEMNEYGSNPIISAGLYISYGSEVVYLFGGSYKEFMGYGAQYMMQWEAIKYAKMDNYKKLNFYGIDGDFRKESKYYGLFDFKRGFNSDVVELIGEFDLTHNKFNYYIYKFMFWCYRVLKTLKRKIIK